MDEMSNKLIYLFLMQGKNENMMRVTTTTYNNSIIH